MGTEGFEPPSVGIAKIARSLSKALIAPITGADYSSQVILRPLMMEEEKVCF